MGTPYALSTRGADQGGLVTRGKGTVGKAPLGIARIVEAAVALADADGFESLSMRNLAQELDAGPMSLYRHFANKEALLDGMIDVVFSEIYSPVIGGAWKTELRK